MGAGVKVVSILAGVALVTTLVLPDRQTPAVIDQIRRLGQGLFGTVMGLSATPTVK